MVKSLPSNSEDAGLIPWHSKKKNKPKSWYLKVVITVTVYSPFIMNTLWVSFVGRSQAFPGEENIFLVPKKFASPPRGFCPEVELWYHHGSLLCSWTPFWPPTCPTRDRGSGCARLVVPCPLRELSVHSVICVLQNQLKSLCKCLIHFRSLFHSSG